MPWVNDIEVADDEHPEIPEVDAKLVRLCLDKGHALLTLDTNLAKAAALAGVRVLNLHALSLALRPPVLTGEATVGDVLEVPINHFEGNYTCDPETLAELRSEDRVVVRYVDNPNGSVDDIAGVCNEGRNVVGLMPHPERACHPLVGSTDGAVLLRSLLVSAGARV